ncbi:hypothetical protein Tco_0761854 [Tanacetum coccineum]
MQTFCRTHFYNDYRDRDSNHDNWRLSRRNDYNQDKYQSHSDDKPDLQKQLSDFIKAQHSTNSFVKDTFMDLKNKLKTTTKNHQASIQNLEAKFDRFADKQSGRPSGSLPSNTQPNPKVNPNDLQNNSEAPINFDSDDENDEPTPQPKQKEPKTVKYTPYPSTWNSIIKEFNYLKVQGVDVFSHCKIRIGNGLHTRFWKDLWIGDCTLSGLFPRLFALDTVKDISVAGKLQSPLVSSFCRNVRGGIEEQLEHLVALLDFVILSNSNDRWVCDLNGDGVFRVKDVRNLLDEFFLPRADIPTRWVTNIPIKVMSMVEFGSAIFFFDTDYLEESSYHCVPLLSSDTINDPQCELLLIRACAGVSKLYFAMRTCPPRVFEAAQLSFDMALRSALEILSRGGLWTWSAALQTKFLRHVGPCYCLCSLFDDDVCVFNASMEIDFLGNPSEIAAPKLMKKMADIYFTRVAKDVESFFFPLSPAMALWLSPKGKEHTVRLASWGSDFLGDVYGGGGGNNAVLVRPGVIGIKHRHNAVRDTLVDICFRSGISAGKEVDIGLSGDGDKALRPANILLYFVGMEGRCVV